MRPLYCMFLRIIGYFLSCKHGPPLQGRHPDSFLLCLPLQFRIFRFRIVTGNFPCFLFSAYSFCHRRSSNLALYIITVLCTVCILSIYSLYLLILLFIVVYDYRGKIRILSHHAGFVHLTSLSILYCSLIFIKNKKL